MRSELLVKTRSLAGSSDLTLLAPIKQGLVPSLESVTYKTRVKRLLKTLNTGRSSSHEYALLRPISDAVERVGKIHSVRVAILEPEDKVLLAVTFDGAWDSYIRVLWQKVGALLDVIFCNTVDYVSAHDHSFEEWVGWAQRVQVETSFFYGKPSHTVDDVFYLKEQETLHRRSQAEPDTDLESTQLTVPRVETVAWEATTKGDYTVIPETAKLGIQALAALYRLTDVYFPASDDGKYLHRAARELLLEFVRLIEKTNLLEVPIDLVKDRFDKQLVWLLTAEPESTSSHREPPELPTKGPPEYDASDVQGGILSPYEGVTHGCLLLTAFDSPAAAAEFITRLIPKITRDNAALDKGALACNVAFTYEGLRAVGLSEVQLACFPQEFREGMEARAGVLGDFHMNHPRRWRLPQRNWPDAADEEGRQVELNAVHAVVQLRVGTSDADLLNIHELNDPKHPLHDEVHGLFPEGLSARLLAVQPLRRYVNDANKVTEHFGFADGEGQPVIDPAKAGQIYRNQVHLGELLLGYANEADAAPDADGASGSLAALERMEWLKNGSFLVVRKLKQDVETLEKAVSVVSGMTREQVLAKMMGRTLAGDPLVPHTGTNDFDYQDDRAGSACPFQAHIRRANPRLGEVDQGDTEDVPEPPGRRAPRLMRRSMSYGPRYIHAPEDEADQANNALDRGLVFMAYNASIGEQFEVVQRWLAGGNSTAVLSGQSDPFLGVARSGEPRYFRFEHAGTVKRMAMDGWDALRDEPKPIVRLEWGAYLFTPSIAALGKLQQVAQRRACPHAPVWSVADGLRRIAALEALERDQGPSEAAMAWKSVLEDPEAIEKFVSASVWAAIREHRNGVLRTPYGVLVADRDLVMKVFQDGEGLYTVKGYHDRMVQSIGEIYLGLDASGENGPYAMQSAAPNAAIQAIPQEEAFEIARAQTALELRAFMDEAEEHAKLREDPRWELTLDVRELLDKVLVTLCETWFGLSESNHRLKAGGTRWDWTPRSPPLYPGNFTAPSRYIFQPRPGSSVVDFGKTYGSTLRKALFDFISDHRKAGTRPTSPDGKPAPIGEAIFGPIDDLVPADLAARTFVGALMGFLPTVDGNLRLTLNEWLRDGTFWSLRSALDGGTFADLDDATSLLSAPLKQAMQLRPSPELVWRTATRRHALGTAAGSKVWVEPGDRVVVSVVSATQQCLALGKEDLFPIFGGDRRKLDHPTHACPGYGAGLGVILGVLSALLEVKESMRPSAAPLAFVFEGPCDGGDVLVLEREQRIALLLERTRKSTILRTSSGLLLAWGDSWFHYNSFLPGPNHNITSVLKARGFSLPNTQGNIGLRLEEMAKVPARKRFGETLERMFLTGSPPKAILLSGGGNDVVRERLAALLNPAAMQKDPFIEDAVRDLVDVELRSHYTEILQEINRVCTAHGASVPVLIHAYDYPIPDGRFIFGAPQNRLSWLYPYITTLRGYDLDAGKGIMRRLIKRLHDMQKSLPATFGNVVVVDVPGTLDKFADHTLVWENELHPTPEGFHLIGNKFADALDKL